MSFLSYADYLHGLNGILNKAPARSREAFAVSCASRNRNTLLFCSQAELDLVGINVLDWITDIWDCIQTGSGNLAEFENRHGTLLRFLDDFITGNPSFGPLILGSCSSLVYALHSCLIGGVNEDARHAGSATIDLLDWAAQMLLGQTGPGTDIDETSVWQHEIVQREVSRQLRDLNMIKNFGETEAVTELRQLCAIEYSLNRDELLRIEEMVKKIRHSGDGSHQH